MPKPVSIEEGATFDLKVIEEEMRREAAFERTGRTARTLVRTEDLRLVFVVLKGGNQIEEHHASPAVSIHVVGGHLTLQLPDRSVELSQGQVLVLDRELRHDVKAHEDSAFLLTLG